MGSTKIRKITHENSDEYPLSGMLQNGRLAAKKLLEYMPIVILTNLSTLVLESCDGIILGNLVSSDALVAVSIFSPASTFITLFSVLATSGIGNSLSNIMGQGDTDMAGRVKLASNIITVVSMIATAIVEYPIIYIVVRLYGLSADMSTLVWQYAAGMMVALPASLVSYVGEEQLQTVGKMKAALVLAAIEGILNILFDIIFIAYLDLGVAGAGYGTAVACWTRCILTVVVIWKTTDIYRTSARRVSMSDIWNVLKKGFPDTASTVMSALQDFFMIMIALMAFGIYGALIMEVIELASSCADVIINATQSSMLSVISVYSGTEDYRGVHTLIRLCMIASSVLVGLFTLVCLIDPALLYELYGVDEIPEDGLFMLRIGVISLVLMGLNTLLRGYFSNKGIIAFSTCVTVAGNALLPAFAYAIYRFFPSKWIWISYMFTDTFMLIINLIRYNREKKKDIETDKSELGVLYLSLEPDDAETASSEIGKYAAELGIDTDISDCICQCVSGMVSNTVKAQKKNNVDIELMLRFGNERILYMMLDDGKCVELDEGDESKALVEEKFSFLNEVAKTVKYQYVLNMNQTVLTF